MAFYMDVTALLETFGTDLTVYPKSDAGKWVDGIWKPDASEDGIHVNEPFIPDTLVSSRSVSLIIQDIGKVDNYDAIWLSSGVYPTDTVIDHHGKRYVVQTFNDLTDYSNVTIYYLKGESNIAKDV